MHELICYVVDNKVAFVAQAFFGAVGSIFGIGGMCYYLVIAGLNKERPTANSNWVVAVWCFMIFKWAFAFTMHLFRYHVSSLRIIKKGTSEYEIQQSDSPQFTIDE